MATMSEEKLSSFDEVIQGQQTRQKKTATFEEVRISECPDTGLIKKKGVTPLVVTPW